LTIVQISDLHTTLPGRMIYGLDTAQGTARCVAAINRMQPRPALVVITGDVVEGGRPEEYQHVRSVLKPLQTPFLVLPGNHDAREPMRAAFVEQGFARPSGPLDTVQRAGPLDMVLLDSSVPGASHGQLSADTLDWLERTLSDEPGRPAILFLHHPPFRTGIAAMDRSRLDNAADLAAIVQRHPRVLLVSCGHVHRTTGATFAGVRTMICPGVNHAVALDLAELLPFSYVHEPPGLCVHRWFPDAGFGELVSHIVPIGDFGAPQPFRAA
jgi:3',5'-cyclic AMP phosphodiesterase CpdA